VKCCYIEENYPAGKCRALSPGNPGLEAVGKGDGGFHQNPMTGHA
jgi:hypothetical protein